MNCLVCPALMEATDGVTAMETTAAAVTVSVTGPLLTAPELAVMVDVPTLMLLARPKLPDVLLTVAVAGVAEFHVTSSVTSCVLLSVNVPVAVNCCVLPNAMEGVAGVTAMETNAAGVTVSVAVALTVPETAVIVSTP